VRRHVSTLLRLFLLTLDAIISFPTFQEAVTTHHIKHFFLATYPIGLKKVNAKRIVTAVQKKLFAE